MNQSFSDLRDKSELPNTVHKFLSKNTHSKFQTDETAVLSFFIYLILCSRIQIETRNPKKLLETTIYPVEKRLRSSSSSISAKQSHSKE